MGIELRHPDINRSDAEFAVERDDEGKNAVAGIRYALAAIKGVGRQAMESVVAERKENGPYRSLSDFADRIDPRLINKRQLENLAKVGAFDTLNPNRAQVLAAAEQMLRHAQSATESRVTGQENLFGEAAGDLPAIPVPEMEDWQPMERLAQERDAMGFYLSAHPLDAFRVPLQRLRVRGFADVVGLLNGGGRRLRLAGAVEGVQERTSARGNRFAFVQLSDATGSYEVTLFSELLSSHRELLRVGANLLVDVEGRLDGESPRLTAQSIQPLEDVVSRTVADVRIAVDREEPISHLGDVLGSGRNGGDGNGGNSRVSLILRLDGGLTEVEVELPEAFTVSPEIRGDLARTPGVLAVQEI